jgi:mRNA interferase MazF
MRDCYRVPAESVSVKVVPCAWCRDHCDSEWSRYVLRADVRRFKLPKGTGHEQHGDRFAVVVQADEFLPRSVVIVAPTSRSARAASFRPEIDIGGDTTRVLVEQIGAVDVHRLGKLEGHLSPQDLWGVDEAVMTVLGLR